MEVNAFNALKTYGAAQKALTTSKPNDAGQPPQGGDGFSPANAVKEMADAVVKSESAAAAFMTGNADPHSVVEAMASAELAVETAVTLRNRVVEAYQELLRMPI